MGSGRIFPPERRLLSDEETGVGIIRVSGFPTINYHVYMHSRCFTFDSRDVVFYSLRHLARNSPRDIFAVSVEGMNLRQVTDRNGVGWMTCSPRKRSVLYVLGKEVWQVDLDSFDEKLMATAPKELSLSMISVSGDGKTLLSFSSEPDGASIMRSDLVRGSTEVIYEHPARIGHLQLEPVSSRYAIFHDSKPSSGHARLWCVRRDGSDPRLLYDGAEGEISHFVWLPGKDIVITTMQPTHRGIMALHLDGRISTISRDEHFWHAASSLDGSMLCSDTLVPDTGLHLVNPSSGNHSKLCLSRSSNAHPQWTHPHPAWSPDGKRVLFTSDRDGLPQVYVANVPEEILPS